jgi:outer membrane receptor protein involved in Fe transport
LVSSKNNDQEGGTRFFDESSLIHVHGEKTFKTWLGEEFRVGANFRRYTPDSDGTIFSDTNGRVITNQEIGIYMGYKLLFLEDKLTLNVTARGDKNQNFPLVISPAASFVWTPDKTNVVRFSFSSALRNPTLADQYLYLDVGPATLVGNLEGATDLVTIQSFIDYRNSSSGANIGFNLDTLVFFDIAPLVPEQVRTIEFGYRTTLGDRVYIDANSYFSWYTKFIGYNIGLDLLFQNPSFPEFVTGVDVYRYAANSLNQVQTQGLSIGVNYFMTDHLTVNGNYSWNRLVKTDEDDPIIPAFNTPEHKYNLGITGRGMKVNNNVFGGFGLNYRWVQGFVFEGSPQFTGFVPQYDLLDAQVNANFKDQGITLKVGASNILRNNHIETYGGPTVGRLAYLSLLYEL